MTYTRAKDLLLSLGRWKEACVLLVVAGETAAPSPDSQHWGRGVRPPGVYRAGGACHRGMGGSASTSLPSCAIKFMRILSFALSYPDIF